jgi:Flp pilus assembly pilin Flp
MKQFAKLFSQFHNNESGQDLLEYALVLAAVLAAVVSGSSSIASVITSALTHIDGVISTTVNNAS